MKWKATSMYDQNLLKQLQARWPETDNYLDRVGQVTNDLMVAREIQQAATHTPSWLDRLAIEASDLLKVPTAVDVLRYLHEHQIVIREAMTVSEYREAVEDYNLEQANGEHSFFSPVEDQSFFLTEASDLALWALPQVQEQCVSVMQTVLERFVPNQPALTLEQAVILLRLITFLKQEPTMSHEWAEESVQSLLSEPFFTNAAIPPAQN